MYVNSDLTEKEQEAETESNAIAVFYGINIIWLIFITIYTLFIFGFVFFSILSIHGAEQPRSIFNPIARCLRVPNVGAMFGGFGERMRQNQLQRQ